MTRACEDGRAAPEPKRERIIYFPARLLDDERLGAEHYAVLMALMGAVRKDGTAFGRQSVMARKLGKSRPWVNRVVKELEAFGLLEIEHQYVDGFQQSNVYRLRLDAGRAAAEMDTGCQPADTKKIHPESIKEESLPDARGAEEGRAPAPAGKTVVPADWTPTDRDLAWAHETHPEINPVAFTRLFVNSCQANGYRYLDHGAAWRFWLVEAATKYAPRSRDPGHSAFPRHKTRPAPDIERRAQETVVAEHALRRVLERRSRLNA